MQVLKGTLGMLVGLLAGTASAFGTALPAQAHDRLPSAGVSEAAPAIEFVLQSIDCDAYEDSAAWCEAGVQDYDCPDIPDQYKPVMLPDPAVDPFRLDRDDDRMGCELPGDGNTSPDEGNGDSGEGEAADEAVQSDLPETGLALPTTLGVIGVGALAVGGGLLLLARRRQVS